MIQRSLGLFVLVFTFIGFCILSSCAGSNTEEVEEPERQEQDSMVARVASVNYAAKYVLIQRFGRLEVPERSILYTLDFAGGNESAASIKVTGERLGQFLAADILTGELKVGDAVYLRILEE